MTKQHPTDALVTVGHNTKKPLPNPPLIREGSKDAASASCPSPDKGRSGGVSSREALPLSWTKIEIGHIAQVISGGTPKASDESNFSPAGTDIAWLTPADLSGYTRKEISFGKRDLSQKGLKESSAKLMPKGSILFSSRAPIGYVAVAQNEISTNQGFKSFVFTEHVDSSYAYYYLKSIKSLAESLGTGTTFRELSGSAAKKLPFVLPPLPEQIRIANKLDSLLAKVETAQTRLEKIPALLKRFRQAVLAAATSGELTREWRGENSFPVWQQVTLIDVIEAKPRNGRSPVGVDYETKIKNLTLSAITKGYFQAEYFKFVDIEVPADSYLWVKSGDLLIQRANSLEYVGTSALYEGEDDQFIYPDLIMKFRANEKAIPKYLHYSLSSELTKKYFRDNATGTSGNMPKINQAIVSATPIQLPEMKEQAEIVRRVESLFAMADTVGKQYQAAKARLDKLTQSILAKAFRGELVPQDPDDEPASELLKRIQAERASPKSGSKAHAAN